MKTPRDKGLPSSAVIVDSAPVPRRDLRLVRFARSMRRDPTPGEKALWEVLRNGRCGGARFRRQEQIGGFIVDFACIAHRVVVEVDGDRHDNPRRIREDAERDNVLRRQGFRVVRFSEWDARESALEVADDIWSWLPGNRRVPSVFEFTELDS